MIVGVGLLRGRGRYAASRTIVAPGALIGSATFTRSQAAGVESTSLGTDDATWGAFAADVPRFYGADRPLLIEGQRTNTFPNPRLAGGTPGTPGTQPTSISAWLMTVGLSVEYVQNVTANGLNGVRYRISGTATGSGTQTLTLAPALTGYAASPGQNWTGSVFAALSAGSLTNVTAVRLITTARQGTGTAAQITTTMNTTLSSTIRRYRGTVLNAPATTTGVTHSITVVVVAGAVDLTLDLFWPQLEQGAFATTPVLPPVGTPGASTRGADIESHTLAGLGLQANGAGTILLRGMLPQSAPTGVNQMLLQVDGGTDANRYVVRNAGGGNTIQVLNVVGGSAGTPVNLGTMTPGTAFSVGVVCDGNGRVAGAFNASAAQVVTSGPTSGLTRLLGGSSGTAGGSEAMFGTVSRLAVLPRVVSDAELQSLVSGFR